MDDTLQRNRWQELAEKASVENNPARLMKLVDELLAELSGSEKKRAILQQGPYRERFPAYGIFSGCLYLPTNSAFENFALLAISARGVGVGAHPKRAENSDS